MSMNVAVVLDGRPLPGLLISPAETEGVVHSSTFGQSPETTRDIVTKRTVILEMPSTAAVQEVLSADERLVVTPSGKEVPFAVQGNHGPNGLTIRLNASLD
ncbi:hypothetical protein [Streptomyces sp. NPDC055085]